MAAEPTIYALSSGAGKAGVAVIRISGRAAGTAVDRLTAGRRPPVRVASMRTLVDPQTGSPLDQALVLWFQGPASFTGEDCAELHVHGGRAVITGVLGALGWLPDCRLAEPGEFTRRAFFNGRLDLTEAEALADLIDADSEGQRRQALRQMSGGGLGRQAEAWRAAILRAQALTEAAIDFSDEADVADDAIAQAAVVAADLLRSIRHALDDRRRGEIVRDGYRVAIVGAPNVGKSSLLNALSRRDVAIVSEEPGTTRDVIEVTLDLDGQVVIISDTAGIRETSGHVEREGIRRSFQALERADLVLALIAADDGSPDLPPELHRNLEMADADVLRVESKIDLNGGSGRSSCIGISSATGEGLERLIAEMSSRAGALVATGEPPLITRERHRRLLEQAHQALEAFLTSADTGIELRAESLRRAASALGRLAGRVDVEDILGEIFGRFASGNKPEGRPTRVRKDS